MVSVLLKIVGFIIAHIPEFINKTLARVAGFFIYYIFPNRRRITLSNLSRAFPHKSYKWCKNMAKQSCSRMAEMALFVVASPYFSKKRISKILTFSDDYKAFLEQFVHNPKPSILLLPHLSLIESLTLIPAIHPLSRSIQTGVFFRPFSDKKLNNYVKSTRERFGVNLLSRKNGLIQAHSLLKNNGVVGILFDQNAGLPGTLSTFFGRLVSTTELPDTLASKHNPQVLVLYTEHLGFWRAFVNLKVLRNADEETSCPVMFAANLWLEQFLSKNDNNCADWLWFHNRWKVEAWPHCRFSLNSKRNRLQEDMKFHQYQELPKKTRYCFRLPNWLGDVVMAIPLLEALKKDRPDVEITLLAQPHFIPLLKKLQVGHQYLPLPKKGYSYFFNLFKYRKYYFDVHFNFTNSLRSDIEAKILNAPHRFGVRFQGKSRPLLTHTYDVPKDLDPKEIHQTFLWEKAFHFFGLRTPVVLEPLKLKKCKKNHKPLTIGFICGTENSPEKRWPIEFWRLLIEFAQKELPDDAVIQLFGTKNDVPITSQVAAGFSNVQNLAGKTNLVEFADALSECDFIVCNDTGGMHLANLLGVPVFALFGPTNPIRTGPVFQAYKDIIRPLDRFSNEITNIFPVDVLNKIVDYSNRLTTSATYSASSDSIPG